MFNQHIFRCELLYLLMVFYHLTKHSHVKICTIYWSCGHVEQTNKKSWAAWGAYSLCFFCVGLQTCEGLVAYNAKKGYHHPLHKSRSNQHKIYPCLITYSNEIIHDICSMATKCWLTLTLQKRNHLITVSQTLEYHKTSNKNMTAWRIIYTYCISILTYYMLQSSRVYGKHLYLHITYQLVSWRTCEPDHTRCFCWSSEAFFCSHPRGLKSCNCPKKAHLLNIPHPAVLWGRHHISLSTCCFETPWRHSRRPVPSACTWKTFLSLVVESNVRHQLPPKHKTQNVI